MRNLLRLRIGNSQPTDWTAENLNRQLNLSAQAVSLRYAIHSKIAYGRAEFALTAAQNQWDYPLTSITDFHSPIILKEASSETPRFFYPGRQVTEEEAADFTDTGGNEDARPYWMSYNPTDTVSPWTLHFVPVSSMDGGVSYKLVYNRLVPEIDITVSGGDSSSYADIPLQFHEEIVQHAIAVLLGHRGQFASQFAIQYLATLNKGFTDAARMFANSLSVTHGGTP